MPKADLGAITKRLSPAIWADPDVVPYAARVSVWGRWFIALVSALEIAYRPGFSYPDVWVYVLLMVPLVAINGLVHIRLWTNRPVTWRWMLLLSAMDIALATSSISVGPGFDGYVFVAYYPALALLAVVCRLSAMWELRRPIDAGHIFEGRELGRVLWSHYATFERITAVPAKMSQSGTEPPLATEVRARLFSIAHNALTNAFVHARPGRVEVRLDFEADHIRLSVSDDGVGLPDDYAERGRGFDGMRADAEHLGGRLIVESGEGEGGTTIACVVPYEADQGGG